MKSLLVGVLLIGVCSFFLLKNVNFGSSVDSKESSIAMKDSVLLLAETKSKTGSYSKEKLKKELSSELTEKQVQYALNNIKIDYVSNAENKIQEYSYQGLGPETIKMKLIKDDLFTEEEVDQAFIENNKTQ